MTFEKIGAIGFPGGSKERRLVLNRQVEAQNWFRLDFKCRRARVWMGMSRKDVLRLIKFLQKKVVVRG